MALATGGEAIHRTSGIHRPTLMAWLLAAPLLAWLLIFVVAPTLVLVVISFCQSDDLGQVVFEFTLDNYGHAFEHTNFIIFVRSVFMAGVATVICLVLGFPVGFYIGRAPVRFRTILIVLVMIPFWTSFLVRTYAWISILAKKGLLNGMFAWLGWIDPDNPIGMLNTEWAVVLGLVYNYLPFMILPIYSSAERLDPSVIEAGYDLGCGPIRVFTKVIIPLMKPGLIAGALLVFVPCLGMFAISTLMGGGKNPMIGDIIFDKFTSGRNQPLGAAMGTLLLVTFLVALWFSLRQKEDGAD